MSTKRNINTVSERNWRKAIEKVVQKIILI